MASNSRNSEVRVDIKSQMSAAIKSMAMYGAAIKIAIEAIKKVISFTKEAEEAYRVQAEAERRLESALNSTGYAVGTTATEMKKLASEMQKVTLYGDEEIIAAQSLLVTFTKIGKDVFPQAIRAAADMSTMLGKDLKQTTIQLGTALNDPIRGITRLRESGVSFTETQRESISAFMAQNDIISAQKIILDELAIEFGGVSEAVGDMATSALPQLNNAMGDLKEVLGKMVTEGLEPARRKWTVWIQGLTESITTINRLRDAMDGVRIDSGDPRERKSQAEELVKQYKSDLAETQRVLANWGTVSVTWDRIKNNFVSNITFGILGDQGSQTRESYENLQKQLTANISQLEGSVIPGLSRQAAALTSVAGATATVSAEDEQILDIWSKLTSAMVEIQRTETDLNGAYDGTADRQAAVLAALREMNAMGGEQVNNKKTLIGLYGQYLPKVTDEAELISGTTKAWEDHLKIVAENMKEYDNLGIPDDAVATVYRIFEQAEIGKLVGASVLAYLGGDEMFSVVAYNIADAFNKAFGTSRALVDDALITVKASPREENLRDRQRIDNLSEYANQMTDIILLTEGQNNVLEAQDDILEEIGQTLADIAGTGFADFFGAIGESFIDIESGAESAKEGIKRFVADSLRAVGRYLLSLEGLALVQSLLGDVTKAPAMIAAGVAAAGAFAAAGMVTALGTGGIVTRPTMALVGERGPEAVIPLGRGGMGNTTNVHIHAGMVATSMQVEKWVASIARRSA